MLALVQSRKFAGERLFLNFGMCSHQEIRDDVLPPTNRLAALLANDSHSLATRHALDLSPPPCHVLRESLARPIKRSLRRGDELDAQIGQKLRNVFL